MAFDYLSSFNSGELSDYMDSRIDIDKYRSGCAKLENMYVLPQGGVERRSGTKYLADSISSTVRLLPFDFSEDESYIIEFGDSKLRIYDGDGYTGIELDHNYTASEIAVLKYKRIFDIMYLVCPTHPIKQLRRIGVEPINFEFVDLEFIYPPLLEENNDFNSLVESQPLDWQPDTDYSPSQQVQDGGIYYSCILEALSAGTPSTEPLYWDVITQEAIEVDSGVEIKLVATEPIFNADMVGAYWNMKHERTENNIADTGTLTTTGATSKEIFIGSGNAYTVNITNISKRVGRLTQFSTCRVEEWNGAIWVTVATYSNAGSYTYSALGLYAASKIRVYKTNDTLADTTYSIGLETNRRESGTTTGDTYTSPFLDVSFSNWTVTTGGLSWTGVMELEKSTDNKETWTIETTIGDTYGVDTKNFIVNSPAKEGANTFIRIKFTKESGGSNADYSIVNTSLYSEGLAIINEYIDEYTVIADIINPFGSPAPTKRWTEGAFSVYRGFPTAIEVYEDRIVYSGTYNDPSTLWMSVVGDFENFQLGTNDDEAIKSTPSTPEQTQWLLTKETLHQGTIGGIINNYSVDKDSVITPSTIKSSKESAFGCQNIQSIFANDVSVYVQRLGKKLRELVYNWENNKFDSNDLTIMASHISDGGITEIAVQKTPDQIIWCLNSDGTLSALTYERNEGVAGWHRHNFGGIIKSIAVRPASGEDELWIAIERDGGTYIEKSESRVFSNDLLDAWYVDSGVKTILEPLQVADNIETNEAIGWKVLISKIDHGLSDGDFIRFSDCDSTYLNDEVYKVGDSTSDEYYLKSLDDQYILYTGYVPEISAPATLEVSGAGNIDYNGIYTRNGYLENQIGDPTPQFTPLWTMGVKYLAYGISNFSEFVIWDNDEGLDFYANSASYSLSPPTTGWYDGGLGAPAPTLIYNTDQTFTGSFKQVSNTWTGLDHLEGETVQIQGDGGYEGIHVVESGIVYTDDYYNQTVIGVPYVSLLQPMFIEVAGAPVGRKKNVTNVVIKFLKTIGAVVGIKANMITGSASKADSRAFSVVEIPSDIDLKEYKTEEVIFRKTTDNLGIPIDPFTGDKLVYLNDGWDRLKGIYIVQNLPMPMTVLGMSVVVKSGDDI